MADPGDSSLAESVRSAAHDQPSGIGGRSQETHGPSENRRTNSTTETAMPQEAIDLADAQAARRMTQVLQGLSARLGSSSGLPFARISRGPVVIPEYLLDNAEYLNHLNLALEIGIQAQKFTSGSYPVIRKRLDWLEGIEASAKKRLEDLDPGIYGEDIIAFTEVRDTAVKVKHQVLARAWKVALE